MPALKAKPPAKAKPSKPKILIFGKPKVGKTWGALEFPSCYYIDTEGGANLPHYTERLTKSGGVYMGPEDGANDATVVAGEVMSLATTKHNYRTLVIDSFSKIYNTAIQIEYDRLAIDKKRDMTKTFGAEKKPAVAFARRLITWFEKLDMNVILICHEKDNWKDGEVIGATFDGWDKLEYELHLALQIVKQGPTRKAKVTATRLKQFPDLTMFEWNYENFAKLYGRDVMEAEGKAVQLASDEQVRIATQLCEVVKLDDDTRIKWFDKAGVDSWNEMDTETIQKCIDHLTSKLPKSAAVA